MGPLSKRVALIVIAAAAMSVSAQQGELTLSAASSLTDALTALKPAAERYIGAEIVINFASSGTLRAQIEQGAPVDVFFSAATNHMDTLERAGLVVASTRKDLLSNGMVLIGDGSIRGPVSGDGLKAALEKARLLSIGNPDSVPAGAYAVEALRALGLYGSVEKKLVLGNNVRQVLQFVESGSSPLGIVFLTDAASVSKDSQVTKLYVFPDSLLAKPVRYPIAVVSASRNQELAAKLIAFLGSDEAMAEFEKAGFAFP